MRISDWSSDVCSSDLIIDSVLDFDVASGRTAYGSAQAMIAYVKAEGLKIEWLLETHAHADHLSAAPYLQERLGGRLGIGRGITAVQETFGKLFNAGGQLERSEEHTSELQSLLRTS